MQRMPARVAKVVIVVDANQRDDGLDYRRYALTSDGLRVDDRRWRAGAYYGHFRSHPDLLDTSSAARDARAAERRAGFEAKIRQGYARSGWFQRRSLVRALRKAGVRATVADLRATPLEVQFTDAAEAQVLRKESVPL
jgi:hypothetical protein